MAPYASFRKCDFQIHSPRDPNWQGPRPPGLGEAPNGVAATAEGVFTAREMWAREFVDACVKKGLRAIAITDHHDMVMSKYVIEELGQRRANGSDPDLWIFPGMELTLQDGVQCLVLFDADLPQALWQQAQGVLGIDIATDVLSATAGPVQQLDFPYDEIASGNDLNSRPSIETTSAILGDGENITKALVDQIEAKRLFALVEAAPRISIAFKYNSVSGPIAFEKASEGQRATVLLMMLLKQGGGPLLVDQPEGDLDNSIITKVVASLHEIKHLRQLVFASHNANLVVNGASEQVAVMNNDDQGRRIVEFDGAIDDSNICNSITSNMEGGKEAFRDRQRKYGF